MALGTDHFDSTDLAVMIPKIWGEQINNFFRKYTVLADCFVDRSEELVGGGDTLHTPNLTEMSANAKSNGSQVTLNDPTETKVDLVVNQWQEVSFLIEDKEAAQVKQSYALQFRYADNAAYTIAQKLDTAIAALFSGFSTTVGASTTNIQDSDIRAAIATLETTGVPLYTGDVKFIFHPNTFWRQVQSIDKFSLAVNSPVNDPTAKKPAGFLYGIPVVVSQNVPNVASTNGRRNVLAHRDAIHFATAALGLSSKGGMVGASGIRVQSNYIPEYLGTLTTVDILYGVVENRDNAAVQLLTHASAA
jgi:hypothetical protein